MIKFFTEKVYSEDTNSFVNSSSGFSKFFYCNPLNIIIVERHN